MGQRGLIAAACAALVVVAAGSAAGSAGAPVVVPLHVEHGPRGDARLGIDVSIDDKTSRVMLSTGSMGLHILAERAGAAHRTGQDAANGYGSGIRVHAQAATATLGLGTARGEGVPIALVDSVDCAPDRPNCPAHFGTPEMFGGLFPGILGVGLMGPTPSICCRNPLPSLAGGVGRSYIVRANFAAPTLTLSPDAATIASFTMVDALQGWTWGCIAIEGVQPNRVCGGVLFDTGSPHMYVTTTGVGHNGVFPNHTPVRLQIGDWSHTFDIGPETPRHILVQHGDQNSIVVGLAYMQDVDVLYDFATNQIGFANDESAAKNPTAGRGIRSR
jgi:hypothetical protein